MDPKATVTEIVLHNGPDCVVRMKVEAMPPPYTNSIMIVVNPKDENGDELWPIYIKGENVLNYNFYISDNKFCQV
jgi:hypothetical protein